MINDDCIMFVLCRMFELVVMVVEVRWVMVIIVWFNCLMFDDVVDVCVLFGELIGMQVDDGFVLILLFYVIGGIGMKFGIMCLLIRIVCFMIWVDLRLVMM